MVDLATVMPHEDENEILLTANLLWTHTSLAMDSNLPHPKHNERQLAPLISSKKESPEADLISTIHLGHPKSPAPTKKLFFDAF